MIADAEAYERGESLRAIARRHGCHPSTVLRRVRSVAAVGGASAAREANRRDEAEREARLPVEWDEDVLEVLLSMTPERPKARMR